MKIIKVLFGFILTLVLLVLILAGVFIGLTYDKVDNPVDGSLEGEEVVELLSGDLKDSLNSIYETDYKENNVAINISIDDINAMIVKEIRENLNKEYLNGEDYVVKAPGFSVDGIYAFIESDALGVRALVSGLGFYHSTVTLSANMSVEGRDLVIQFNSFRLGKRIGIKKGMVLNLFSLLKLDTNEKNGFDLDTLSYKVNVDELIKKLNLENEVLKALFNSDISISVKDNKLSLILDTTDIFNKGSELPSYTYGVNVPKKLEDQPLAKEVKLSLNSDEANSLVKDVASGSLLDQEIALGSNTFTMRLEGLYLDLAKSELRSNILIDRVKSSVLVKLDIKKSVKADGEVVLLITPTSCQIGSTTIANSENIIKPIEINSKSLGIDGKAKIKDIVIDANRSIIEISVAVIGL